MESPLSSFSHSSILSFFLVKVTLSHRRGRYGEAMPLMKCRIAGDGWCNFQFSVASHHLCTEEEPPFEGGVDLLPPRKRCGDFNAASCFRCRH